MYSNGSIRGEREGGRLRSWRDLWMRGGEGEGEEESWCLSLGMRLELGLNQVLVGCVLVLVVASCLAEASLEGGSSAKGGGGGGGNNKGGSSDDNRTGTKIAIWVGSFALIVFLGILIFCIVRHCRRNNFYFPVGDQDLFSVTLLEGVPVQHDEVEGVLAPAAPVDEMRETLLREHHLETNRLANAIAEAGFGGLGETMENITLQIHPPMQTNNTPPPASRHSSRSSNSTTTTTSSHFDNLPPQRRYSPREFEQIYGYPPPPEP